MRDSPYVWYSVYEISLDPLNSQHCLYRETFLSTWAGNSGNRYSVGHVIVRGMNGVYSVSTNEMNTEVVQVNMPIHVVTDIPERNSNYRDVGIGSINYNTTKLNIGFRCVGPTK